MGTHEQIKSLKKRVFYSFPRPTMTPQQVRERFDDLPVIEPESELPGVYAAFLQEALENYSPDNDVCEFLIYSLSPGKDWRSSLPYYQRRYGVFTEEQMNVLFTFLEMVKDDLAFSDIWHQVKKGPERLSKIWEITKSNKAM